MTRRHVHIYTLFVRDSQQKPLSSSGVSSDGLNMCTRQIATFISRIMQLARFKADDYEYN